MILAKELMKRYPHADTEALSLERLSIQGSGIALLLGPSGSGKSTLLSLIGALMRPTRGELTVLGERVADLPERLSSAFRREKIGCVFQSYHLIFGLTALENVALPLIPATKSFPKSEALLALERIGMGHKQGVEVSKLSGGERQRVAIARALVANPPLILADEPTANLDRAGKELLMEQMREIATARKRVVIATHDLSLMELEPDYVVELHEGRIAESRS